MIRLARALIGLSGRERLSLAMLALLGLPVALWFVLMEPLLIKRELAHADLAEAEDLRAWMITQRQVLGELSVPDFAGVSATAASPEGLSGLEARLQAAGLTRDILGAGVQLTDAEASIVSVNFQRVDFGSLMAWLDSVEVEAGYRLTSLIVTAAPASGEGARQEDHQGDGSGQVAAELRLEPAREALP